MFRLFLLSFIFLPLGITAQNVFTTYQSNVSSKPFNIYASTKDNGSFSSLIIDMYSNDDLHPRGGIMIDSEKHKEFLDKLTEAKFKYSEWVKVAKQNKVKDFRKEMKINFQGETVYFFYDETINMQMSCDLQFLFSVIGENMALIIKTGPVKSLLYEDMTHKGFSFIFMSEKEISDFVNKISIANINEYLGKPKTDDLFKD